PPDAQPWALPMLCVGLINHICDTVRLEARLIFRVRHELAGKVAMRITSLIYAKMPFFPQSAQGSDDQRDEAFHLSITPHTTD
ncbi:hypothetical protein ABXT21_24790, partial [Ralstonia sp. SM1864_UCD524_TZ4]|uniref:hypothetical protein n=1 Tax=Ralstonia pseudosolanacearum TaxID=1310165 RepID=UPI0033988F78